MTQDLVHLTPAAHASALWNRDAADLRSDEVLAQLLDRSDLSVWRQLYALGNSDSQLRARIVAIVATVPMASGWFWAAALWSLGEQVRPADGEI